VNTAFEQLFAIALWLSFWHLVMLPLSTAVLAARMEAAVATVSASMAGFEAETRNHFVRRCCPPGSEPSGRPGHSIASAVCTVFLTW
jgi:hypothetical protein